MACCAIPGSSKWLVYPSSTSKTSFENVNKAEVWNLREINGSKTTERGLVTEFRAMIWKYLFWVCWLSHCFLSKEVMCYAASGLLSGSNLPTQSCRKEGEAEGGRAVICVCPAQVLKVISHKSKPQDAPPLQLHGFILFEKTHAAPRTWTSADCANAMFALRPSRGRSLCV